jgi:DNA-binding response OmpR family regulator
MGVLIRTLGKAGYEPLPAATCEEALKLAQLTREPIEALVADYLLPTSNGTEAALKLAARYPKIKTLFISGTPLEGWSPAELDKIAWLPRLSSAFLPKPFHPATLVRTLDGLLHRAAARTA